MAFTVVSEIKKGIAIITLAGELDGSVAGEFKAAIEQVSTDKPKRLVLDMNALTYMASAGLRTLVFAKQKMGNNVDIYVIGVNDAVWETIELTGFQYSVIRLPAYDAKEIENV